MHCIYYVVVQVCMCVCVYGLFICMYVCYTLCSVYVQFVFFVCLFDTLRARVIWHMRQSSSGACSEAALIGDFLLMFMFSLCVCMFSCRLQR